MHRAKAECYVFGALALILRVSRCLGVAPLTMKRVHRGWRMSISPVLTHYGYYILFVLHAIIIFALIRDFNVEVDKSIIYSNRAFIVTWLAELTFVQTISTIGVFGSYERMKDLIDFMNIIEKINPKSNKDSANSPAESKRYAAAIAWLVLINIQHIVDLYWHFSDEINKGKDRLVAVLYGTYYIESLIVVLLQMQSIFLILQINANLKVINDSLNEIKSQYDEGKNNVQNGVETESQDLNGVAAISLPSDKVLQKVQHLNLSFGALCDIIGQANDRYGILLLLLIGMFFLHLIEAPYYISGFISAPGKNWSRLVIEFLYYLMHFSYLIMTVEPAHRAEKEVDRTALIISQLLNRVSPHDKLVLELDLFCKQIELSNLSFSPLGVFTLNRPLVTAVWGGVTTYIVIIFQFLSLEKQLT